jgi:Icc-related predicted phosphoesterase
MSENEEKALARSKEKLKKDTEKIITDFFDDILNISEVAIGDEQRYRPFRSKVLRSGNDAIREIKKILDRDYKVLYVPSNEDILQMSRPSMSPRRPIKSNT